LSILIFSMPAEIPTGSGAISAQITKSYGTYDKPAVRDGLLASLKLGAIALTERVLRSNARTPTGARDE